MIYKKIQRFAKKIFSSKTYTIAIINRFIPQAFGQVTDISLNKDEKNISVNLQSCDEMALLSIKNYHMHYKGSRSFVAFDSIYVDGFLEPHLKKISKEKEIEIDPRYIKLVQTFLRA